MRPCSFRYGLFPPVQGMGCRWLSFSCSFPCLRRPPRPPVDKGAQALGPLSGTQQNTLDDAEWRPPARRPPAEGSCGIPPPDRWGPFRLPRPGPGSVLFEAGVAEVQSARVLGDGAHDAFLEAVFGSR